MNGVCGFMGASLFRTGHASSRFGTALQEKQEDRDEDDVGAHHTTEQYLGVKVKVGRTRDGLDYSPRLTPYDDGVVVSDVLCH